MTWWNLKSKPEDDVIEDPVKSVAGIYSVPEDSFVNSYTDALKKSMPKITPDPEPNLSTKPADIVGYCFGYVCPKKHVGEKFEAISVDGYKQRRACQTCGVVSKPAIVRRISEAYWVDSHKYLTYFGPNWGWRHNHLSPGFSPANACPIWTRYEFVHFLDKPVRKR
jgi:hypothetical protein